MRNVMDSSLNLYSFNTWQLLKMYWRSKERFSASLFLITIVIMSIALVAMDVVFTYWSNYFYDGLQAYNRHWVTQLLFIFLVLAAFNLLIAVYRYYISQLFGLRWRRYLTTQFVDRWLAKYGYYYLENFDERTDNPDQRIQEDIAFLVSYSIDLFTGIISAVTTFCAFIYVLWSLSGTLVLPLGPLGTFSIKGYLVWVSVIYAIIGTTITFKVGRPLVNLNFEQQRREATFRFAAVDLRSHSEHVALYHAEPYQKSVLQRLFNRVLSNWYLIILRQKLLLWFTVSYNQLSVVLPLVVALPNYFNKVFMLGGLMQSIRAFTSVQDSLSYLVNAYVQIAQWQAVTKRLTTFVNHLNEIEHKTQKENDLAFKQHNQNTIEINKVSVEKPDQQKLLKNINETFKYGQDYLIKGSSGIGKSTFLRAIAGIWPFAQGEVTFPSQQSLMFLPQKPYMPLGTLYEAILFPEKKTHHSEKEVKQILKLCNLAHLIPKLHDKAPWSEQLSPGEQQRITFARVLLQKPDWIFLDESTSMLDITNEKTMYTLLREQLPKSSIISVGHRPSLAEFHDHVIDMSKYA